MIAVFAAMLSERRIIFTSRRLDRLSSCIQAASSFLYPMVWQHIFIPILPMKMKDFLCAPMPYLIGVPDPVLRTMSSEELGEVVILNCDNNELKTPFDDVRQMPPELVSQMKKHLSNTSELMGDRISKIFLRILVQLIGGYRDAAKYSQGQKITWDRDTFIESRPLHLRQFLSRMMELQIFQQFIDERLNILNSGQGISDEFEMETLRYMDEIGKRSKNHKGFLRNVKDKTNPAVKSAVKSVKEGSRGVKTAYKDLKHKLRDITPPKLQFHVSTMSSNETDGHDSQHRHHSAPNSPVFSKRILNTELASEVCRKPYSSYSQFSHSNSKSSFHTYSNENAKHNNNIVNINSCNSPLGKSPSISPSSSLCASEMNISQELQNHPLFRSPNVNRTLKPVSSLDMTSFHHKPRFGAPADASTMCNIKNSASEINFLAEDAIVKSNRSTEAQLMTESDICIALNKSLKFTRDIASDSLPNMSPPPIPPKRRNGGLINNNSTHQPLNLQGFKINYNHVETINIASSRKFDYNHFGNGNTTKLDSLGAQISQSIKNEPIPIPAPRHMWTEMPKMESNAVKDLISLDESSNNFDLSDLDPLNPNANPIPGLSQSAIALNVKSTTISSINDSFCISNPLYSPFAMPHRHQTSSAAAEADDSETELLRQYGLDKFNFKNENVSQSVNAKSEWATFD